MNGKVKFFKEEKGFGFVTGEDSKDYYFHMTNLLAGTTIAIGDEVAFEIEQGEKGPKAVKVSKMR